MTETRLRRLDADAYRGIAAVHWAMTIQDRRTGWLDPIFHLGFREVLLHSLARFECVSPAYCLMPDHIHILVVGFSLCADQREMMRHFRRSIRQRLQARGFDLQKQAFDHVLRTEEHERGAFAAAAEYIVANPVRADLAPEAGQYPFSGAVVPGYPELHTVDDEFWWRFWRLCESRWRTPPK